MGALDGQLTGFVEMVGLWGRGLPPMGNFGLDLGGTSVVGSAKNAKYSVFDCWDL